MICERVTSDRVCKDVQKNVKRSSNASLLAIL